MPLDPPSVEGPLGLRQIYPPVALKYPLVQKLIETPDFGVSEFNKTEKRFMAIWRRYGEWPTKTVREKYVFHLRLCWETGKC